MDNGAFAIGDGAAEVEGEGGVVLLYWENPNSEARLGGVDVGSARLKPDTATGSAMKAPGGVEESVVGVLGEDMGDVGVVPNG